MKIQMNRFATIPIIASCCLALGVSMANSQPVGDATAEARARLACGAGKVVSAQYQPGGLIRVECEQQTTDIPSTLQGTTLTPQAAAGVAAGVLAIVLLAGDSDSDATTTSTSTTGN